MISELPLVYAIFGIDDAIVALSIAAIGAATSAYGGLQQASAMKKAERARARQEEIRASRERMSQVREAIAKRASIEQSATNQGSAESSAGIGGAQGVTGQLGTNQAYITQQQLVGESLSRANQQIADAQGVQVLGAGIADVGGTVFANRKEIKDIFKS